MQIEVGKKYRMRGMPGSHATIMEQRGERFAGKLIYPSGTVSEDTYDWSADGMFSSSSTKEYDLDLVEEIVVPAAEPVLAVTVGRWRMRGGSVANVTEVLERDPWPVNGYEIGDEGNAMCWTALGRYAGDGAIDEYDLIERLGDLDPKPALDPNQEFPEPVAAEADGLPFLQDDPEIELTVTMSNAGVPIEARFVGDEFPPATPPTDLEMMADIDAAMTGHSQLPRAQQNGIYAWFTARYRNLAP